MNTSNSEHRIVGHASFRKDLYKIAASDTETIIQLSDFEIKSADKIYYSDLYQINDNTLILYSIRIEGEDGEFPSISGVLPESHMGATIYKLKLPISYSGTIVLQSGYRKIGKDKNSLLNQLFGCNQLISIKFEDGKVAKCKNMNRLCRRIYRFEKIKSLLMKMKKKTPLQELVIRDYSKSSLEKLQERYSYYMEYFNA
jgi:hypothetical protein